ncbi:MAG: hypothetical protein HRU26_15995 [Psychroserpens sp.]|nr:hypothetical protein [Psychroserpens sp.]
MKIICYLLNIIALLTAGICLKRAGLPDDSDEWLLLISITCTPLLNLIFLYSQKETSYLGLYFKRKKMEEENKIKQLKASTNEEI